MRGKAAVRAEVQAGVEFGEEPLSGVRAKSDHGSVWEELVGEVQRMAHLACRDVPQHVRADVESAAMVGLMEAVRDFEEVDPEHFQRYVEARVWSALQAEADHFDPESSRTGQLTRPANDNRAPSSRREVKLAQIPAVADERSSMPEGEPILVPLSDAAVTAQLAHEDILTAETAFVGSYAATALRWGLAQLEKRERLVLRLAYKRGLALAAIAQRLHVSTPRAYQIRVEAERKLARLLRKSPALSKMNGARTRFDWDDHTEETARARAGGVSKTPLLREV